jgi:hypothetical protein
MRRFGLLIALAVFGVSLGLVVAGCNSSPSTGKDKMEGGKLQEGKMEGGKMQDGKMEGGKIPGDKMQGNKMQDGKMEGDKMEGDKKDGKMEGDRKGTSMLRYPPADQLTLVLLPGARRPTVYPL